jgi:Tol biopolymer transport system component
VIHRRSTQLLAGALIVGSALLAVPAQAANPGANGKIAVGRDDGTAFYLVGDIWTMNPDGSSQTALTSTTSADQDPAWSPDGTQIAFGTYRETNCACLYVMNADGTNPHKVIDGGLQPTWSPDGAQIAFAMPSSDYNVWKVNANGRGLTRLTDNPAHDFWPSWSPDGTKIAFMSNRGYGGYSIWMMNADGSNETLLTDGSRPDWSPDGTKIAINGQYGAPTGDIWTINPDGTGKTQLTHSGDAWEPAWSPDGRKLAFTSFNRDGNTETYTINADGTGEVNISNDPGRDLNPSWQPLPRATYGHPQSASSLAFALIPVFEQCGTGGNPTSEQHAPALSVGSCPPAPTPGAAAHVGPQMQGSAQLAAVAGDTNPLNGDQADVTLSTGLTDIQTGAGADYNPNPSGADLTQVTRLRLTDQANGYGGTSATATDFDLAVPIDCVPTVDPLVGSTCTASTTADTLIGGFAQEQRQTVTQVFRVRIYDSGLNGVRQDGTGDDEVFAHGGIFTP